MEKSVALGGYTPTSLHYVRNHGPTPRLDWGSHRVEVTGLVDRPTTFTMDHLVALPSVTIPITLVRAASPQIRRTSPFIVAPLLAEVTTCPCLRAGCKENSRGRQAFL